MFAHLDAVALSDSDDWQPSPSSVPPKRVHKVDAIVLSDSDSDQPSSSSTPSKRVQSATECEVSTILSRGRNEDGEIMFEVRWTDGSKSWVCFESNKESMRELIAKFEDGVEANADCSDDEETDVAQWDGNFVVGYELVTQRQTKVQRAPLIVRNDTADKDEIFTAEAMAGFASIYRQICTALDRVLNYGNATESVREHNWWLRRAIRANKLLVEPLDETVVGTCTACGTVKTCSYEVVDQECEDHHGYVGRDCRNRIRIAKDMVRFLYNCEQPVNADSVQTRLAELRELLDRCARL